MAAKSAQVVVAYGVQVNKDTPFAGAFKALNRRSGGFTTTATEIEEGSLSSKRLADAPSIGRRTTAAQFEFTFREEVFDDFLRSAFASAWVAGAAGVTTLELATTPVYLTFAVQTSYLNTSTRHFTLYTGCVVTSLSFAMPQEGFIALTIQISAANKTYPATAPWTSLVDPAAKSPLKTCTALTSLRIDAVEIGSVVSQVDLSVQNVTEEIFDVRQCDPKEIILGSATIGGTISAYHDDESDQWSKDADAETLYAVDFTISGETIDYLFSIPSATNRSTGPDASGENVTVSLPFGAVTTAPVITRTVR